MASCSAFFILQRFNNDKNAVICLYDTIKAQWSFCMKDVLNCCNHSNAARCFNRGRAKRKKTFYNPEAYCNAYRFMVIINCVHAAEQRIY